MTQQPFGKAYSGTAPENYERYFVPSIAAPLPAVASSIPSRYSTPTGAPVIRRSMSVAPAREPHSAS